MKKIYFVLISTVFSVGIIAQTDKSTKEVKPFDEEKYLQIAKRRNIPSQDIKGYINAERVKYLQGNNPELKSEHITVVNMTRLSNAAVFSNYCPNADFSMLDYSSWVGDISNSCSPGTTYPVANWLNTGINGNNGNGIIYNTDPCNNATDYQVVMNTQIGPLTNNVTFAMNNGYDPNCKNPATGFYDLSLVPPGATTSVRLGSAYPNYTSQKLVYALTPTPLRSLFTYKYAIVIDDGGHPVGEQPAFLFGIKDANGNVITGVNSNCVTYNIDATAAGTDTSFIQTSIPCSGNIVYYRKWHTITVDLTSQIGNTVYAEFQAIDCPWSGHYCYAYISANCEPADVHVSMCSGVSSQFLSAPQGFFYYQWYGPNNMNPIAGANYDTLTVYGNQGDNYTVDCITLQGCTTKIQTSLQPSSLNVYYYNGSFSGSFSGNGNINMCNGNNINLVAFGANTYTWSPNAGSSNNDTVNVTPSQSSLTYSVIGTEQNGCVDSASINFTLDTSGCVWPGDANEDLLVDNMDLLPVGIKWFTPGPARSFLSTLWFGYACNDWNDTLQSGVNTKYTDCNGSGLIEMNDTLPIYVNYNATHAFKTATSHIHAINPELYLSFNKSLYYPGDTLLADVMLGSSTNPMVNFYGAAFTLDYEENHTKNGSQRFNFNNSWVGNINTSMIKLEKLFAGSGYTDAALVRINHNDTSGFGKIAQLRIILKDTIGGNGWLYFTIHDAIKTVSNGEMNTLACGTDSVPVVTNAIGVDGHHNISQLSIFPNPSTGSININCSEKIEELKVYDVLGKTVLWLKPGSQKTTLQLDDEGVYFITVKAGGQMVTRKVVISN